MAEKSKIAWTESTWNPWLGCTQVSAGCKYCYAEVSQPIKQRKGGSIQWGEGKPRVRTVGWDTPLKLDRKARSENRLISVFPSLCDVFDVDPAHKETLDKWRNDFFDLIGKTQNLVWLLLTKRPQVAAEQHWRERIAACGANVWIGTSTENQAMADVRVPILMKIPARNRFISAEPLLGPLDLTPWIKDIDWVIVGGESGSHAREMKVDWARNLRDNCRGKTPFFFKQIGGKDAAHGGDLLDGERIQQRPDFAARTAAARPASATMTPHAFTAKTAYPLDPERPAALSAAKDAFSRRPPEPNIRRALVIRLKRDAIIAEEDIDELARQEEVVDVFIKTVIFAGLALHIIKTYKEGLFWKSMNFRSFEEYCLSRFRFSKSHAYRLAKAGKFVDDLEQSQRFAHSPIGDWMPLNENQIRPIVTLLPENEQVAAWERIVSQTPPCDLRGVMVERIARKYANEKGVPLQAPEKCRGDFSSKVRAQSALNKLDAIIAELPAEHGKPFAELISNLKNLIAKLPA